MRPAEQQLRRLLGPPTRVLTGGCPDNFDERSRTLSWPGLWVTFSDEGNGGPMTRYSWTLERSPAARRYLPPYAVRPGDPVSAARRAIPDSRRADDELHHGVYLIRTDRRPFLAWISARADGRGVVDYIHFRESICD